MRYVKAILVLLIAIPLSMIAESTQPASSPADAMVDRMIQRERELVKSMHDFNPLVETYIQNVRPDDQLGTVPTSDKYFLGRLVLDQNLNEKFYVDDPGKNKGIFNFITKHFAIEYLPRGFAGMILVDGNGLDREHYSFKYLRREFLGEVRCVVFDVEPKEKNAQGRFLGRIWAEDQDFNIVRFNGIYSGKPAGGYYFHLDSWRLNLQAGQWLPSYVYSEEENVAYGQNQFASIKAQTRLWGYNLKLIGHESELAEVLVDASAPVNDHSETVQDATPLQSQRAWERQAEDNVVDRMEKAGLLAPKGEVDKVMETVVNNLEITNNLDIQPDVRCRVLLTAPLESFTVGHTIVVSRGLLDVLPDESSLAMVLSHELGHIVLGHRLDTKFSFHDRMLFADEESFRRFAFAHNSSQEQEADAKAMDLLKNSPYKDKLGNAGLFLLALEARAGQLPELIKPRMGDPLAANERIVRMASLMSSAPKLEPAKLDQIAALPLGGRIRMEPWSGKVELIKAKPAPLLSAREKMPFEVTPFFPHIARQNATEAKASDKVAVNSSPQQ